MRAGALGANGLGPPGSWAYRLADVAGTIGKTGSAEDALDRAAGGGAAITSASQSWIRDSEFGARYSVIR